MNILRPLSALLFGCALLPSGAAAQSVASFPFFDGFESGSLAPYWTTTVVQGAGQAVVTTANGPYSGLFHLTIDGTPAAPDSIVNVDLAVDLAGQSGVVMDFAVRDYGDEEDPEDGIFISDDGVNFVKIFALDNVTATNVYQVHTIDLDKAVVDAGLGYSNPFYIRLGWNDQFNIPTDGFGFDDITLRSLGYTSLGLMTSTSPTAGGEFGASVTGIADLDGDGFREVAIGHPNYSSSRGRVELFSGKTSKMISQTTKNEVNTQFGRAIASLGDLDGDGFDELLIGAPAPLLATSPGAAYVISTKTGEDLHVFAGAAAGDQFGSAVASVPDLNGDGIVELLVGAPKADGALGKDSGLGYVYSGADYSLLLTLEGPQAGGLAGSAVDAYQDLNGDGVVDLIMGAPEHSLIPILKDMVGAAHVFSGVDGTVLRTFTGDLQKGRFGASVLGIDDVTGDGLMDVVVGATEANGAGGLMRVFDGANGSLVKEDTGTKISDRYGASLARIGDIDGDGTVEFGVGTSSSVTTAPGYVRVFSLPTLEQVFEFGPVGVGTGFGNTVAGLGDINGDTLADVALGSILETAGGASEAGVVRVASTAGAPEVTSVEGVHTTLSGDAVIHGVNLLGNLTAKVDGVPRPVTFVSPLEALVSLDPDVPGGFHDLTVGTDLGGVTLPGGLVRYPAMRGPSTLALGANYDVELENGEPGAYLLAFSNQVYATPASFENFGWFYGLDLNGVWIIAAGTFSVGDTNRQLSLPGTSSANLLGTDFYLQAWALQQDSDLAGFTNTLSTTIVP